MSKFLRLGLKGLKETLQALPERLQVGMARQPPGPWNLDANALQHTRGLVGQQDDAIG
jgi:hypothetical protein